MAFIVRRPRRQRCDIGNLLAFHNRLRPRADNKA
jgi:hypothetical protein